jgi:hypothetical protein
MSRPRWHARTCRPDVRSRHRGGQIPLPHRHAEQKPKQWLHQYHGHDAIPASRRSSVDSLTDEGLADAVAGADIVVDVADSPLFCSTVNLLCLNHLGESPFLSPTVSRTGFV